MVYDQCFNAYRRLITGTQEPQGECTSQATGNQEGQATKAKEHPGIET